MHSHPEWCHPSDHVQQLPVTHLDTLLGEISAGPVVELHHHQPVAQRLDGPVHSHNPPGALGRHVQVVGDSSGCDLQHVIWSALVQEDLTERRQERPRRTPGTGERRSVHQSLTSRLRSSFGIIYSRLEAAVDVVRHEQQHAELLQSDELHVALIALTHLQPLQQGVWVHVRHDG